MGACERLWFPHSLPWRAGAGRPLEAFGPFPRQRAGAAKWGARLPIDSVRNGMVLTATGRYFSKALRPAP